MPWLAVDFAQRRGVARHCAANRKRGLNVAGMCLTRLRQQSDQRTEAPFMNITLPILLAGALTGGVIAVADTSFPQFNPAPGCKAASAINQSIDLAVSQDYKACMADEDSAKKELQQSWSKYSANDKKRCVGQTEDGGMPSYVEVQECLVVTIGVDVPGDNAPPANRQKK
jgi:hypothetical protein